RYRASLGLLSEAKVGQRRRQDRPDIRNPLPGPPYFDLILRVQAMQDLVHHLQRQVPPRAHPPPLAERDVRLRSLGRGILPSRWEVLVDVLPAGRVAVYRGSRDDQVIIGVDRRAAEVVRLGGLSDQSPRRREQPKDLVDVTLAAALREVARDLLPGRGIPGSELDCHTCERHHRLNQPEEQLASLDW